MNRALVSTILQHPDAKLIVERVHQTLEAEQHLREQFYNSITEQEKVEFINGEIVVHSPVKKRHADATNNLYRLLSIFVEQGKLGFVGYEKIMIALSRNDYEPDIVFFNAEKSSAFQDEQSLFPTPDLVVEVLSSSTSSRDRGIKFEDYEAHGILEYWIIDADERMVEQYVLEDGRYELLGKWQKGDTFTSVAVQGFRIPQAAIFNAQLFLETLSKLMNT